MADDNQTPIKQELVDPSIFLIPNPSTSFASPASIIVLSSSDSDSDEDDGSGGADGRRTRDSSGGDNSGMEKSKRTAKDLSAVLPLGLSAPLPSEETPLPLPPLLNEQTGLAPPLARANTVVETSVKQFWKAGDYEGAPSGDCVSSSGGMDHVRVHPKFLHSNATSHKWVLGALAELLENSLDEACNGATYVNIDMVTSKKDGSKMLLIEDNGGGMDPNKMRHCMSLGYSAKSKIPDTIGQYGNGFKTVTMRLGADAIVFSRCRGRDGRRPTQSIGLLSYTFLRSTGKEDIVVPMLDYERSGLQWNKILRTSATDWNLKLETMIQWSPFPTEVELLQQFNQMQDQGTRIIIYNLWEDEQGLLELDFDTGPHDIQIRGVNRDEKSIDMARKYPNSRHFLTYRHSLRSYAAILYLRIPPSFRIILRGEDVEHHNIVNDMMMTQEVTYRPQPGVEGIPKDINMVAVVTIGFVKDAEDHIDVQGFNVYHKNRLIKPFWRVWQPPGSDGRGVIGLLEANFVEPAHDKQGFERTTVLARLETRLIQMQKTYWRSNCHKIGYAPRHTKKAHERDSSPDSSHLSTRAKKSSRASGDKMKARWMDKGSNIRHTNGKGDVRKPRKHPNVTELSSSSEEDVDDIDIRTHSSAKHVNGSSKELSGKNGFQRSSGLTHCEAVENQSPAEKPTHATRNSNFQDNGFNSNEFSPSSSYSPALEQLKEENLQLKERLRSKEEIAGDLLRELQKEKDKNISLEAQLQQALKEQECLVDVFSEERQRRDNEEEDLRKKLKEASNTIEKLLDEVKRLKRTSSGGKLGQVDP